MCQRNSIGENPTAGGLAHRQDEIEQCALAGADTTDNANALANGNRHRNTGQDRRQLRVKAKGHALECKGLAYRTTHHQFTFGRMFLFHVGKAAHRGIGYPHLVQPRQQCCNRRQWPEATRRQHVGGEQCTGRDLPFGNEINPINEHRDGRQALKGCHEVDRQ